MSLDQFCILARGKKVYGNWWEEQNKRELCYIATGEHNGEQFEAYWVKTDGTKARQWCGSYTQWIIVEPDYIDFTEGLKL